MLIIIVEDIGQINIDKKSILLLLLIFILHYDILHKFYTTYIFVPSHSSIESNEKADVHAENKVSKTFLDITLLTTIQETIKTIQLISIQTLQILGKNKT